MITPSVNNNLATTLFGKARRAILSLLYGHTDESFYLRQIVRATGTGVGPVQRELKQLSNAGVIQRTVRGKQVYYQANRQSPVFNELHGLIVKTVGVADVLRSALAPSAGRIKVTFVFGSIARSTENRFIDIDLLVVGNITFGEVVDLLSTAEEKLGREVNAVVYPISQFKQKIREDHYFVKTVLEGEKIFLIGDEGELAKLTESLNVMTPPEEGLLQRFPVPESTLSDFCQKHHIKKLALFGSVLGVDFRPDSDIDVLVEFEPGHVPGFGIIDMENELSQIVGRKVDLRTPGDLSRYFRDRVVREARVKYAASQS